MSSVLNHAKRTVRAERSRGAVAAGLVFLAALGAVACDDRTARTRKVLEAYAVVPGKPQVDTAAPSVLEDNTRATDVLKINTLRQCDIYRQLTVRKVDILWVVDSSGSMAPKQARLAQNFQGFINQLVNAKPPIDFHIAVVSTDTDDPLSRGVLRSWGVDGGTGKYIACTPAVTGGRSDCNTDYGTNGATTGAVTAFQQMAAVGITGSAQERGLYAAYLALTNPANRQLPGGAQNFIRNDAALYVVVVSDEDDASCHPLVSQPVCTADPGCRCAPDTLLGAAGAWGSTGYFTRFLETYKGYGNADLVALAAIVALDGSGDAGVPSQFGDPSQHVGCCRALDGGACPKTGSNNGSYEIAYFADRYVKVASNTGGVAVSICQDDFSGALASLGYAASGLRREFKLTRSPELRPDAGFATGIDLFMTPPGLLADGGTDPNVLCSVDGNCPTGQFCRSGRCARRIPVNMAFTPSSQQYVKCDSSAFRNVIRFDGTAVPESESVVEICYDVASTSDSNCF